MLTPRRIFYTVFLLLACDALALIPLQGVSQISGGDKHTCVVMADGGIRCWGYNFSGQLGDGTTTTPRTTVQRAGNLAAGFSKVAAGGSFTCGVTTGGAAQCWGFNGNGELGAGFIGTRPYPDNVLGLSSGVAAITAGTYHACALTTAGAVKCWGSNLYWETGSAGDTTPRYTPVDVPGLSSGALAIAAGTNHTCAITSSNGVKCWGRADGGELGNGMATTAGPNPVDVTGLTSGVLAIVAGDRHTCALTSAGGMKCWGYNFYGQVGDSLPGTNRTTPFDVPGLTSGVAAIAAGGMHTCARTGAGAVKCWGYNGQGQLGDGTTTNRPAPVDVVALGSGATLLAAGSGHTCVLVTAGLQCWGYNIEGQLGDARPKRVIPADIRGVGALASVAAGQQHSCAVTSGGGAKCWGDNLNRQLGDGTTTARILPVDVSGLSSGVSTVGVGAYHSCARTTAGGVKCWGNNGSGSLGNNSTTNSATPVDVTGLTSGVSSIAVGYFHTCAVTTGGAAKCWGNGSGGQLGNGGTSNSLVPVDVTGLTSGVVAMAAGSYHTCAITTGGGVKCWGANFKGSLGDGTTDFHPTPVDVTGLASGATAIAAGDEHTCAVVSGAAKCWGGNAGKLGNSAWDPQSVPVTVTGLASGVASISAGQFNGCALKTDGSVKCWGTNTGDGTDETYVRLAPVDVSGLGSGVTSISGSFSHSCARRTDGTARCWGSVTDGRLGDGSTQQYRMFPAFALYASPTSFFVSGPATSTFGDPVTLSVSGASAADPGYAFSGSETFTYSEGAKFHCVNVPLGESCTINGLAVGTHGISVTFGGSSTLFSSVASKAHTVQGVPELQVCATATAWLSPTTATGFASASVHDTGFNPAGKSYAYLAQGPSIVAFRNVAEDGLAAGTRRWASNWNTPSGAIIANPPNVVTPSAPSPASEVIFAGADDGFLYKINPDTDPPSTMAAADTRRRFGGILVCPTSPGDSVTATPAVQLYNASNPAFKAAIDGVAGHVHDDLVFAITDNGCGDQTHNRVIAYWASDLSVKWTFNGDGAMPVDGSTGGCALDYASNTLFCGTDLPSGSSAPSLFAIDTITGALKWSTNAGPILNRPVLHQGRLYVANLPGALQAYNPAGNGVGGAAAFWATPVNAASAGAIVLDNIWPVSSSLLVLDTDGILRRVDDGGASGSISWAHGAEPGVSFRGAPVAVQTVGKAYIGRDDGYLQQVNLATGAAEWVVAVNDSGHVEVSDASLDTEGPVNFTNRIAASAGGNMGRFKVPFCPANVSLTVSKAGLGSGVVTTTDGAINCGSTCTATYPQYSWATLQAAPDAYSAFGSWSGSACPGSTNANCSIVLDGSKSATAAFNTPPRTLLGAFIRKSHGGAGTFDFPLVIGGGTALEPRGGSSLELHFQFDGPIVSTNASSGCSNGSMAYLPATGASSIGVSLTGVQEALLGTCSVVLNGSTTQASVSFGVLPGDVNGSRSVTASDILRAKGRLSQSVTNANFIYDTNTSGVVEATDVDAVKGRSGVSVP